jgi:hypothetical protein
MSTDFRLLEKAPSIELKRVAACQLFDGRLEEFGVREHVKPAESTATSRCLTEGLNYLWVYIDDDGFVCCLRRYAPNGIRKIF